MRRSAASETPADGPTRPPSGTDTKRSACRVCPTQYATVSRKLPTMIAMAASMARLTARAATETASRDTAADRFA